MKNFFVTIIILSSFIFCGSTIAQTEEIKIKTSSQCNMCKDRIEKALSFEKGIVSSNLDVATKVVSVIYKPAKTNPDKIRIAVSKVGYQADDFKADPIAYENLPSCCKLPEHGQKCNH